MAFSNGVNMKASAPPSTLSAVSSINASGGSTGMTFSGGPVTTAGTLTLGGVLSPTNGGTGRSALGQNYVLLGNFTSPVTGVAPGTAGYVLTSDGATWTSAPPTSTVSSFNGRTGAISLTNADVGAAEAGQLAGYLGSYVVAGWASASGWPSPNEVYDGSVFGSGGTYRIMGVWGQTISGGNFVANVLVLRIA
jgi:hypothetical protein